MITYNKFKRLNIDIRPLGIEQRDNEDRYFCTPKGATIIGWAGVDGIHYCFVRGFGEMVFAISPMNTPEDYVHPLARTFSDFLRLLLSCKDAVVLEQAHRWGQATFDSFLEENPATNEQLFVMNIIANNLGLEPMDKPFTYIKQLQAEFDYSKIKFTEDYDDFIPQKPKLPEWNVYYGESFWEHSGRQRSGKEIAINMQFTSDNKLWHIPSIYTCSKGLVIDFCVQILAEHISAFINKWNLSMGSDSSDFTKEEQMRIGAENPMTINFSPEIILNDRIIPSSGGCGLSWNPYFTDINGIESEGLLNHYGLDPASGWVFWRSSFLWPTKRKPKISSLEVLIRHEPVEKSGLHFSVSKPGESINFIHPKTNVQHKITIHEYEQQEMTPDCFGNQNYDYPNHYTLMVYTLSPDLPSDSFSIRDYEDGDLPRRKEVRREEEFTNQGAHSYEPQAQADCMAIGIIGGSTGPTAIALSDGREEKMHATCSALRYSPTDTIEWHIVFHEKPCDDITVKII